MHLKELTKKKLLKQSEMSRSLLSIKINRINGRDFTTSEAKKLADHLNVKVDDFFKL